MGRRIFISYQHLDRMKAKGFNLLRWNTSVDLSFVGRHLLDPVDSTNHAYIAQMVREQLQGTSVTVVLIGKETYQSGWVADEVSWSLAKAKPNGVVGIRLEAGAKTPPALVDCGAEVIDWAPAGFQDAIERAARLAARAPLIVAAAAAAGGGGGGGCSR
jgi:hypothetical protein